VRNGEERPARHEREEAGGGHPAAALTGPNIAKEIMAGYAAAIAYVLLIAILSLTLVQLWVGKRLVYYSS